MTYIGLGLILDLTCDADDEHEVDEESVDDE